MLSDKNSSVLDLADVRYIERIVIGRYNPNNSDDDEIGRAHV